MTAQEVLQPFNDVSAIKDTDKILLEAVTEVKDSSGNVVSTTLEPAKVLARTLRAYFSKALTVSIGEDGTWYIGGVSTGVSASVDAPLMRAQAGVIQYSIDNGMTWQTIIDLNVLYGSRITALETRMNAQGNVVEQTAASVTIDPNVLNVWTAGVAALAIAFADGESGKENEYKLQFTIDSEAEEFTLTLPDGVRWANGEAPEWEAGNTYQLSVLNGLAIYAAWEAG